MKKLYYLIVLMLGITLILASCDSVIRTLTGEASNPADKAESYTKAIDLIRENVDLDKYKIYSISFDEGERLSNDLYKINLSLVNNENETFKQIIYLDGTDGQTTPATHQVEYGKINGIDLNKINPAAMAGYVEEAKTMLPEGHSFRSISNYYIDEVIPPARNDLGTQKERFSICFTEDGNSVEKKGHVIQTNYYESTIHVEPDGTLSAD